MYLWWNYQLYIIYSAFANYWAHTDWFQRGINLAANACTEMTVHDDSVAMTDQSGEGLRSCNSCSCLCSSRLKVQWELLVTHVCTLLPGGFSCVKSSWCFFFFFLLKLSSRSEAVDIIGFPLFSLISTLIVLSPNWTSVTQPLGASAPAPLLVMCAFTVT